MSRVTLGSKAVQQLRDTYARVKAMPFGGAGPRHEPRLWNPGTVRAKVITAITVCSGTTPGTGAADIYRRLSDGTMTLSDSGITVSNWSTSSGTIPVDTHIMICWADGEWCLVSRDC